MNNESEQDRNNFKGYPLNDFIDSGFLKPENLLNKPTLMTAIMGQLGITNKIASRLGCDVDVPASINPPGSNTPNVNIEETIRRYFDGLYLGKFKSYKHNINVKPKVTKSMMSKGKWLNIMKNTGKGRVFDPGFKMTNALYIYEIGINADKRAGFVVRNPFDTQIIFGPPDEDKPIHKEDGNFVGQLPTIKDLNMNIGFENAAKSKKIKLTQKQLKAEQLKRKHKEKIAPTKQDRLPDCDLNFRIVVDQNNHLHTVSMYGGNIEVFLSKGLVQPVYFSSNDGYVKTGNRLGFKLGTRMVTFQKNRPPTWGGPINMDGQTVAIRGDKIIGKLNKINLSGSYAKPLIVFDDVEILGSE